MTLFVRKTVDFVFDTRTVARSYTLDLSGKKRCPIEVFGDDLMGRDIGIGDKAG
ncbi:hypothetical protein D1872_321020 [compost metagenome]